MSIKLLILMYYWHNSIDPAKWRVYKNSWKKTRAFKKIIYFFARLFCEFMQIIWKIRVFQVKLQLPKLLVGFLTTLGKGAQLILQKNKKMTGAGPLNYRKKSPANTGVYRLFLGAYQPKKCAANAADRVQGEGEKGEGIE